jgi:hypothetical protein
MEFSKLS